MILSSANTKLFSLITVGKRFTVDLLKISTIVFVNKQKFFRRVISRSKKTDKIKTLSEMIKEAVETFYDEFDYYPDIAVYAPGKFTIMGDHLEYVNCQLVQAALPMGTVIVGKSFNKVKSKIMTTSKQVDGLRKAFFPIFHYKKNLKVYPDWVNYIKGVIGVFPVQNLKGFEAIINSNVPFKQGYGSSAALQVAFYTFLEALNGKRRCESKEKKGNACRTAEIKSQGEKKIGQWDNLTSAVAEESMAVRIDCWTGKTTTFEIKDINILFLLTYPNFEIELKDRDLIPQREMELKLIATLVGLQNIRDATESHLEVLANMEDPSKEEVIEILQGMGYPQDTIFSYVEQLFFFPKIEVFEEQIFFETEGEAQLEIRSLPSQSEQLEHIGEALEDIFDQDVESTGKHGHEKPIPAPKPSPVSYIHQRIAELCDGKINENLKEHEKICEEINCLGGIDNLSLASDVTVCGKLVKRLRHIVSEKTRCFALSNILHDMDYEEFGTKLIHSHLSLKLDYEVSCPTLDTLVQLAIETKGVYGSKMMSGGGTLTLLHRSVVENYVTKVLEKFKKDEKTFQFYLIFPSCGAKKLSLGVKNNPRSTLSNAYPHLTDVMKKAVQNFISTYRYNCTHGAYAPEVITLMGDHTDYNHGFVLGFAMNISTVVVGAFNGTSKVRVTTTTYVGGESQKVIFPLDLNKPISPGKINWVKSIKGVIAHFGNVTRGFDCFVASNMPSSSHFSNRKSLVVAFYTFLEELYGKKTISLSTKAHYCMIAEHEYCHYVTGVSEYNISIRAKDNYTIFFDCGTTICSYIPFQDPSVLYLLTVLRLKTMYTFKASLYTRMEECFDVAKALGRKTLRCCTLKELENLEPGAVKPVALQRAKHVLSENDRSLKSAEALKNGEFETLGELMVASHNSLRDDFEVVCQELDFLVKRAMEVDGVLGSKACSAFQTCTISLVKKWAVDDLIEYLQNSICGPIYFYIINPFVGCGNLDVKTYIDSLHSSEIVFEDIFTY